MPKTTHNSRTSVPHLVWYQFTGKCGEKKKKKPQALQLNVAFPKETGKKKGRSQDLIRKKSWCRYFQRENTMNLTGSRLYFVIFFSLSSDFNKKNHYISSRAQKSRVSWYTPVHKCDSWVGVTFLASKTYCQAVPSYHFWQSHFSHTLRNRNH